MPGFRAGAQGFKLDEAKGDRMSKNMVVRLSDDLTAEIDALSSAEGVSADDWVKQAIESRIFIRRFRAAREKMLRILDERGEQLTDEDVFRMVS
jgi:predicted DNA-binding protein